WKAFVRVADFQIVAGAEMLSDYLFGGREIHHHFCRRCGVHPFAGSSMEPLGGAFYAINIGCLDDVTCK
ncbi:GFA family protein, partial [Stenotrophomonas maltophilia]|uniref:GFA family protein n=1 Tax=Stenotrophomonas maltophilia TaxID=40324 RepID=UPI0019535439